MGKVRLWREGGGRRGGGMGKVRLWREWGVGGMGKVRLEGMGWEGALGWGR